VPYSVDTPNGQFGTALLSSPLPIIPPSAGGDMVCSPNDQQVEYEEQTFLNLCLNQNEIRSKRFYECDFIDCDLSEAIFSNCRFIECKFAECNLSLVKLKNSSFVNTYFENSKVIGVNWLEASWPTVELFCPIEFFRCDLSHSTFFGLSLREIRLTECLAKDVDFREADLTEADLTHTDFTGSLFMETNLTRADFSDAINYHIDVGFNKVKAARFTLPEAVSLLRSLDIEIVDDATPL
jgi:uncharacterized protein YjbI with pentapeptide repeats